MKVVNARTVRTRRDCRAQKVTRMASSIALKLNNVSGATVLGLGISMERKFTRVSMSRWRGV